MTINAPHIPVMLNEVLSALAPAGAEVHVDGTFGAGGYSRAILDKADCRVIGIDRDSESLSRAESWAASYKGRLILKHGRFGDARALVAQAGFDRVDGFVLDLGVSSMQLDQGARGFSFRHDGPLDMRMDQKSGATTAAEIVNRTAEKELADIIYIYGEERHSRRVARAIVAAREEKAVTTTFELADIVRAVVPKSFKDKTDPATRTFQALRIAVNGELDELKEALIAAEDLLREGGRLVVVSFHSLEDKIVKSFLQDRAGLSARSSRHLPEVPHKDRPGATFVLPSRKAIPPTEEESRLNPRARSAHMRVAIRTNAPTMMTEAVA